MLAKSLIPDLFSPSPHIWWVRVRLDRLFRLCVDLFRQAKQVVGLSLHQGVCLPMSWGALFGVSENFATFPVKQVICLKCLEKYLECVVINRSITTSEFCYPSFRSLRTQTFVTCTINHQGMRLHQHTLMNGLEV